MTDHPNMKWWKRSIAASGISALTIIMKSVENVQRIINNTPEGPEYDNHRADLMRRHKSMLEQLAYQINKYNVMPTLEIARLVSESCDADERLTVALNKASPLARNFVALTLQDEHACELREIDRTMQVFDRAKDRNWN